MTATPGSLDSTAKRDDRSCRTSQATSMHWCASALASPVKSCARRLAPVMTFGHPESALLNAPVGPISFGLRHHKGYIIRKLEAGHFLTQPHPRIYELPPRISGVLVDTRFMPRHALHLIGVRVGNQESETVAFSHTEVVDGSATFREKTSKIELYGLAHDLLPLADWAPPCGWDRAGQASANAARSAPRWGLRR
jgi:hypothetical protein